MRQQLSFFLDFQLLEFSNVRMSLLDRIFGKSSPSNADLSAKIDAVESQMRLLKNEWSETYDKIHHALDRVAKRWQRLQGVQGAESGFNGESAPKIETTEELLAAARQRGLLR
jgi:hypothetical protein